MKRLCLYKKKAAIVCFLCYWNKLKKFYSKNNHFHDSGSGMEKLHALKYAFHFLSCVSSGTVSPLTEVIQHTLPGESKPFFLELFLWRYFGAFCYSVFAGLSLLRKQMSTRTSMRQSMAVCGWDHLFWQKQAVKWAQLPHDTSLYTKQQVTGFPKSYLFHQEFKNRLLPAAVGTDQICIATQGLFVQGFSVKDEIKPAVTQDAWKLSPPRSIKDCLWVLRSYFLPNNCLGFIFSYNRNFGVFVFHVYLSNYFVASPSFFPN